MEPSAEDSDPVPLGPALPPHLVKPTPDTTTEIDNANSNTRTDDPVVIGPALPPHLLKKSPKPDHVDSNTSSEDPVIALGPALPPHLLKKYSHSDQKGGIKIIGPTLPPNFTAETYVPIPGDEEEEEEAEACDEVIGPVLPGGSTSSSVQMELEERALQIKLGNLSRDKDDTKVREEWMLELPQVKPADSRMGARQFRAKPTYDGSKDRSGWTETPADREKRRIKGRKPAVDLKEETKLLAVAKKNEEQEKILKNHKRKSSKSLVEIHESEMKKKKEGAPTERKPFNREVDLKVNRFDDAQKKAILKKAQHLDDRFSSGQSKFL